MSVNDTNDSRVIIMDTKSLSAKATEYFIKICGLNQEGQRFLDMRNEAMALHEKILPSIDARAVVRHFESFALEEDALTINDTTLRCSAFNLMDSHDIRGAITYLLSVKFDQPPWNEGLLTVVFWDAWGTAYVDAARDFLYDTLAAEKDRLTDSFGPGFYGMDTKEMGKLFTLIDNEAVGVSINDGYFLIPQKSCAGLYLHVEPEAKIPTEACRYCEGNKQGCAYCNVLS